MSAEPESSRKLFLGGLDYSTTEDGLRNHFEKYGKMVDVVVMRFPDTKRSRGFGFITYSSAAEADASFEDRPHTLDGASIETKRATPREEMNKGGPGGNSETHRKVFIGGLNYSTTDDTLRDYFSKFGELVDCVVMKFRDTKRSRGFGFVTYATLDQVDECQKNRPHSLDGTKVETKRATPRDDSGPGAGQTVTKCFLGGLKDGVSDDNLTEYFGEFGTVVNVEQMTDKSTGRKRGFGFVEFDDYDAVDKCMLKMSHNVNGYKIDVKKAISRNEMNSGGGGGGMRGGRGMDRRGGGMGGGNNPAPWGGDDGGYGGGYGGGMGGGYGGGNEGYGGSRGGGGDGSGGYGGGNSGWGGPQGGGNGGNPSPWGSGGDGGQGGYGGGNSWGGNQGGGNQGGGNAWNNDSSSGWGNDGGYSTENSQGGYGGGQGGYGGGQAGGYGGGGPSRGPGGPSGGGGGPMRGGQGQFGGGDKQGYRSAPYSVGARGQAGGSGGYSQRGGGGQGGRW